MPQQWKNCLSAFVGTNNSIIRRCTVNIKWNFTYSVDSVVFISYRCINLSVLATLMSVCSLSRVHFVTKFYLTLWLSGQHSLESLNSRAQISTRRSTGMSVLHLEVKSFTIHYNRLRLLLPHTFATHSPLSTILQRITSVVQQCH
jgi:hypothetical protein